MSIDAKKLDAFSLDTLKALKEQVTQAIKRKQRALLRPGSMAEFSSEKYGKRIRIMIERINPKTVGGYEIDIASGAHLTKRKWRVAPEFLEPYTVPVKPPAKPLGVGADAPATGAGW